MANVHYYNSSITSGTTSSWSTSSQLQSTAITSTGNYSIYNSISSAISIFNNDPISQESLNRVIAEMMTYYDVTDPEEITSIIMKNYGVNTEKKELTFLNGWKIKTKDGTVVSLDDKGNLNIDDSNSQVIYRGNTIRDFNKYLNASDLLEQFIRFVGTFGVRQSEVLNIPIETFINWLIIEAAKMDGEQPPDLPLLEKKEYKRCLCCGKFISNKMTKLSKFCSPKHFEKYMENV